MCGNTNNTNETLTRPENRSLVCGNTSDTVTKPNHRALVFGNTNNINNIPRTGHRPVCGNTNHTNDKSTRPENRLPVYENNIQTAHK